MIEVELKVNNTAEIMAALEEKSEQILEYIGGMAEGYAKELAPVGKEETTGVKGYLGGSLRDSIRHEVEGDTVYIKAGGIPGVYRDVNYAVYVEFGTGIYAEGGDGRKTPWAYQDEDGGWHITKGMEAQPYMRPAINDHLDEYINVIENELGN